MGVLSGCELAMPDSCCHVFCLSCLLTWAEVKLCADYSIPPTVIENKPFFGLHSNVKMFLSLKKNCTLFLNIFSD